MQRTGIINALIARSEAFRGLVAEPSPSFWSHLMFWKGKANA